MKKEHKKVLAREFLFLLGSVVISLIVAWIWILPYNWYQENKAEALQIQIDEIQSEIDLIESNIGEKLQNQKWIFSKIIESYDLTDTQYDTRSKLWKAYTKSVNDSTIVEKWNTTWVDNGAREYYISLGFENPEEWRSFIVKNTFSESDSIHLERINELLNYQNETEYKRKEAFYAQWISEDEQFLALYISLGVIFSFTFFLRYLFYAVKWSMKQVRS
jgi:hypothetical protein